MAWKRTLMCICVGALVGVSLPSYALSAYSITNLGTLGGGFSVAWGINSAGQVVGGSPISGSDRSTPFLYSNGVMHSLGTLVRPSGLPSGGAAMDLNDAGQAVGNISTVGTAFIPPFTQAFLYRDGTMTDIGTLGGPVTQAQGINNGGQVVGDSNRTSNGPPHAFLYSNGAMIDLGNLGGTFSVAYDINNAGQVVGTSHTAGDAASHAFLYGGGVMRDLGTLGGIYSIALGINDAGQVIGGSNVADNVPIHAILYSEGNMKDLGTLGGTQSMAWGINNVGQVVGTSYTAGDAASHAFLYSDGVMTDLNSLEAVQEAGWDYLSYATDINNIGQMVGFGNINGQERAFLLKPVAEVPEPPVVLLMAVGILGLVSIRNHRKSAL